MNKLKFLTKGFALLGVFGLLSSCGGGDSSPETSGTGIFLDSAVSGLGYSSISNSGTTSASGNFSYKAGETINFHLGTWSFGSADAASIITPLDLAGVDHITTNVVNRIRLLQTLDSDTNLTNGIQISIPDSQLPTGSIDFDVSEADFESNQDLLTFLGAVTNSSSLVSRISSVVHLQSTINSAINLTGDWTRTIVNTSNTCGYPLSTQSSDWRFEQTGGDVDIFSDESVLVYEGTLDGVSLYATGSTSYQGGGYEIYFQTMGFTMNGDSFTALGEWQEFSSTDELVCSGTFTTTGQKTLQGPLGRH